MIQQEWVYIDSLKTSVIFVHDDVQFVKWCNECIEILNRVKNIEKANMHVYDVIAHKKDEYSVQIAVIFNEGGRQLEGSMYISYEELIDIAGLDKTNCIDIVNIDDETKVKLYKFLLRRLWDYYRYGKKRF